MITKHTTSRGWAGCVLVLMLALVASASGWSAQIDSGSSAPVTLPPDSQSAQVQQLSEEFAGGSETPAIVVFTRDDGAPLSEADLAAASGAVEAIEQTEFPEAAVDQLAAAGVGGAGVGGYGEVPELATPLLPVADELAQAVLTIPSAINGSGLAETVKELRAAGNDYLREAAGAEGLDLYVTGPAGFAADTASAFDGANFALLGISALIVAVLLIITYRSPILFLVPLLSVALADRLAAGLVDIIANFTALEFDESTGGIMSVLVFGAGTNYALLLISRYREELRREDNHRTALGRALTAATPAILSSNLTVVLALLALALATVPSYVGLGISLAIGLLIALASGLFVLPAALALCGRGLFWPKIPQVEDTDDRALQSRWYRVATWVSQRPKVTLSAMVAVLLALGMGITTASIGLTTTEQFRTESEAVAGLDQIAEYSLPGAAAPVTVIAPATATEAVNKTIEKQPEFVTQGEPEASNNQQLMRWTLIDDALPATEESFDHIRQLRHFLAEVSPDAIVGGQTAETLDNREATIRDTKVVIPAILAIVFVLLVIILRALVAPVLLLLSTTLSAFAALGTGAVVSQYIFQFPALDVSVPLYSMIFLIALGIDYTVFLVLRAREEAATYGTFEGMNRAVGLTGGVITSAGVVLAAVFAVLGVLPLITLGQVGIVVGLGIVLDTFLVRTLVVPALFAIFGDRMWLPGRR